MPRKKTTASTPALKLLVDEQIDHATHTFPSASTDIGLAAAEHLGVDPGALLKTLVVDLGDGLGVCCVPAAGELNLKKAARAFGVPHARMADRAKAQRATGYVLGGISPLGQRTQLPTLIDASTQHLDRVYVSAGKRGMDVALSPADLAALTRARFVDLTR